MRKKIVFLAFVVLLAACQPNPPDQSIHQTVVEEPTALAIEDPGSESILTESAPPEEIENEIDMTLKIAGPEEVVFDWTTDRCEDENIPDIAPRAFRDSNGMVSLTIGHLNTYRMVGPDLDNLEMDCSAPIMTSDLDADPAMFNDGEWIGSLYTPDGETVYAILHSEYRGHLHGDVRPEQCPSNDYLTCLDTALTLAISTDGGASFHDFAEAPNHLIATLPYTFDDQVVPSGLRQPSNIIEGPDGYFYVFSNISDYPNESQWMCLMRTDNLDDPTSWRYWDGSEFSGEFLNPYLDDVGDDPQKCTPLNHGNINASMTDSVTYNTVLDKYILLGMGIHPTSTREQSMWGVYYSYSDNLIEWSPRRLLLELPMVASVDDPGTELIFAYPVLLDPSSPSLNFDTTDNGMYLYVSRFNLGGGSLDRDLVRWPVELSEAVYEVPDWEFETDGDDEGWWAVNHIADFSASGGALSMAITGDDPYMESAAVEFPARENSQLSITMKVSEGDPTIGEFFFLTSTDREWDGEKYTIFDVIADGEFHTYVIELSVLDAWQGLITQVRLDPIIVGDRTLEIDRITFSP